MFSAKRRLGRVLGLAVLAGGPAGVTWPAWGQVETTPVEEAPNIVIPQRHVVPLTPGVPADQSVALATVGVVTKITEQVAATTLRITLRNPAGRVQEAQMLVPVPDGAVVRHFELEGLGEQGVARVLPRDEARRIYDSIVRRSLDPGLLEFAGYNMIRSSVFPVPAGGEQAVTLTYEQVLPAEGDRVDYVLPRSESLVGSGVRWSYRVEVRGKRPIATVYSPSHEVVTERHDESRLTVHVTEATANDPGSFILSLLHEKGGDGVTASLLAYPDPEVGEGRGGYFLLLGGLPAEKPEGVKPVKREVTLVIDRSGSMRGEKMEQAREAAAQIVEALEMGEAFNIIDYSDTIEMFAEKPVIKTEESLREARAYIKALTPTGGTNIHDSLVEALRQPPTEGMLPMVLFMTDGLPTIGQRSEVAIREAAIKANVHKRRIFTFGVGFDVNTPLLSHVADNSRASATFVLPEEDVEVKVGRVFRRLSGPVLADPELVVAGDDGEKSTRLVREVLPARLPDYFEGDQVVLLGQYADQRPIRFRLSGDYFGQRKTFEFSFDVDKASTRNSFVPRLWASRKIGLLIDEIRQGGANGGLATANNRPTEDPRVKELIEEVVRLSTRWGILTEYTSFLATEPGVGDMAGAAPGGRRGPMLYGAPTRAGEALQYRAGRARTGAEGVNQELNLGQMKQQAKVNASNRYWDKDLKAVEVAGCRQVNDQTLFQHGARWIDARVLALENPEPQETIDYGTPEFDTLLTSLISQNRQGVLAMGGEIVLWENNKCVLVRGPDVVGAGK